MKERVYALDDDHQHEERLAIIAEYNAFIQAHPEVLVDHDYDEDEEEIEIEIEEGNASQGSQAQGENVEEIEIDLGDAAPQQAGIPEEPSSDGKGVATGSA